MPCTILSFPPILGSFIMLALYYIIALFDASNQLSLCVINSSRKKKQLQFQS